MYAYTVEIGNPDAISFSSAAWHGARMCWLDNISCTDSFTPAVTGTYFVAVVAEDSTIPYTLRLNVR